MSEILINCCGGHCHVVSVRRYLNTDLLPLRISASGQSEVVASFFLSYFCSNQMVMPISTIKILASKNLQVSFDVVDNDI